MGLHVFDQSSRRTEIFPTRLTQSLLWLDSPRVQLSRAVSYPVLVLSGQPISVWFCSQPVTFLFGVVRVWRHTRVGTVKLNKTVLMFWMVLHGDRFCFKPFTFFLTTPVHFLLLLMSSWFWLTEDTLMRSRWRHEGAGVIRR